MSIYIQSTKILLTEPSNNNTDLKYRTYDKQ